MEMGLFMCFVLLIAIISCLMFCNGWETEEEDFDYGEGEE